MKSKRKAEPTPAAPESPPLPPISEQMQKFLNKSFLAYPGRRFYHLEKFAAAIESELVSRGLVQRGEFPSKGRALVYYFAPDPTAPPSLDI